MATVYLAEDLKHHRKVAIKVLREELAASLGPRRFVREINIAAALTHPHILPLHDSGEAAGLLFYVMPLVDGPTLRQRLYRFAGEILGVLAAALGWLWAFVDEENLTWHDHVSKTFPTASPARR